MDKAKVLKQICKELKIDEDEVTNAYQFGSYVYGTNHKDSSRDFLLVTRKKAAPIQFTDDVEYFHHFQLDRICNKYDVCVHSTTNFETLLEKHYLLAVECVFYPDEFILKNNVDYRSLFLNRYYNPLKLRQRGLYEYQYSRESNSVRHPSWLSKKEDSQTMTLKILFQGIRYLDFVEQLISKKTIEDFKRISPLFTQLKETYQRSAPGNLFIVFDYLQQQSDALIQQINQCIVESLDVMTGTCCLRISRRKKNSQLTHCTHLVHRDCLKHWTPSQETLPPAEDEFVMVSPEDEIELDL